MNAKVARQVGRVSVATVSLLLCHGILGCARSPSFNILGSYFPGWIACILLGVLVTTLLRLAVKKADLEERIPWLPIFYLSFAVLIACTVWLISFD